MARENEIRDFLIGILRERAAALGKKIEEIADDCNILEEGLVDSMGFLELITEVEDHFHLEVDFSELEPGAFTTLKGLVSQCARSGG